MRRRIDRGLRAGWSTVRAGPAAARAHWPALVFALGVFATALVVRWWILAQAGWLLEGDDALSALMAFAILEGDRPLMLKNQAYAGAWQPYAMAASYLLFGASRLAARLPAIAASLAFVGATWLLAREVAGAAAGRFTALLMAVPPVYILVLSLKPLAPYTEIAALGTLALWCAARLLGRPDPRRDGLRALACGALGGLAFWLHPLAVYYLAAIAALCLLHLRGRRLLWVAGLGVAGFVVGALPLWLYNLQTRGATLYLLLAGTRGEGSHPRSVLMSWWNNDVPRAAGLWNPWGEQPAAFQWAVAALLVVAVLGAILRRPLSCRAPRPVDGTLLLLAVMPVILVLSGFGESALYADGIDVTGRYMLPFWGALGVVLGVFLAAVWRWRRAVALGLAAAIVGVNVYGYAASDPVAAFQSTYWDRLPVDNAPLLAVLRTEGVAQVWMNHWAGFPVMLDARIAGQPLIAYDWHDVEVGGIDRFPEYRPLVERAERAAFVLVTDDWDPELSQRLRALGVSYRIHRVWPYVVVRPTSRVVHPSEVTGALDERY